MEKQIKEQNKQFKKLEQQVNRNTQILLKQNVKKEKQIKKAHAADIKKKHRQTQAFLKDFNKGFNPVIKEYEAKLKKQEKKIKKLEKKYLPKPPAPATHGKSLITCYLYVEKKAERANYSYKDENMYQRDSTETGIYKTAKKFTLAVPDRDLTAYEVGRFYNDRDDGIEIIDEFLEIIKGLDESIADVINKINMSDTLQAFKITIKAPFNPIYDEPVFAEKM